jgi:Spy/CpxP family protein refolding chaperone
MSPLNQSSSSTSWIRRLFQRPLLVLMGAVITVGGLAACSHRPFAHEGPMTEADAAKWREKMVDRVSSKLDLDATQKTKLVALANALRAQRQSLAGGADATPMRNQVQALVAGDHFDSAKAQALVNDKTEAMRKGGPAVIAATADFFDSLKPEQQQKVRDFMNSPHGHHGWGG